MIQTMIYGADVDVAEYEDGKALLITDPLGIQWVVPLSGDQEIKIHRATSSLALPNSTIAPPAQAS